MAVPWWEEAAYLAYKLPNLYADVGGVVSRGTVRPHWLAQVLGEWMFALRPFAEGGPKLTWGTDGPPAVDIQPMIEFFAEYQMPEELGTAWGFPSITRQDKERIFGGYWLAWLGIDREAKARELAADEWARRRREFQGRGEAEPSAATAVDSRETRTQVGQR